MSVNGIQTRPLEPIEPYKIPPEEVLPAAVPPAAAAVPQPVPPSPNTAAAPVASPKPMSLGDPPILSKYKASHGAPSSEFSVGNDNGSITWNPGAGSVKGALKTQTPVFQSKLKGEVEVGLAIKNNKDGNTEITVSESHAATVNAKKESEPKKAGLDLESNIGGGSRERFKVILPGPNADPAVAAKIDPFNPTTIPVGATVIMDEQNFVQTDFAASFRHIGAEVKVKSGEGSSYSITRVDDKSVQVMMGPSKAFEAYGGVGVRFDTITAVLGSQNTIGSSTVRTATFDISIPDGQKAFEHFTNTGEVVHQTAGVSDVATIERVDLSSQARLQTKIKPTALLNDVIGHFTGENPKLDKGIGFEAKADLALNEPITRTITKTTLPDGSFTLTRDISYRGNLQMEVVQRFDTVGKEIPSATTYEFTLPTDGNSARQINFVTSGGITQDGPVTAGQTVNLKFTEAQMLNLSYQANAASKAGMGNLALQSIASQEDGSPLNAFDFAMSMATSPGQDPQGFGIRLVEIARGADGDIGNPGFTRLDFSVDPA
ncbi:hypothetical protein [Lysobacter sp. CA199]|uniref:hypothetical protein n=1 Tax=Lysobacter sp. CA199 TaxID=3455608 RepID=UPI003F8D1AC3